MAIGDDFSVAVNGDIRYTGTVANYTVLEFHRWLAGLADDPQASGDDLVDITSDTPSDRSTDQIITLNSPYNIDDTAARHLYDGSISQNGGDDLYSGLRVLGTVTAGTEVMILQDDKVLPAYYGTGINPDAANQVIMRILVKSRSGGADIDGKRILVLSRELGDQFKEFPATLGLANSVAAVSTATDLNNTTARATIEGWSTIANIEGFQLIDIDNNGTPEEYYAQFDIGIQSVNDTYEWAKLQSARSLVTDSNADVGTNFVVDNATIVGQGQEFTARAVAEKLSEMRFRLKVGGGVPTGPMHAELIDSNDVATAAPTGAVLATSEPVLASVLQAGYQEIIFRFEDNVTLTAGQAYFAVIRHPTGDAVNFVHVEGLAATGTHAGNRAEETGVWTGVANDDLWFVTKATPIWHSRPGERHRGITHEIVYDTEVGGPFVEDEIVFWGSRITYDGDVGVFQVGEYVKFERAGAVINGGKVLKDETVGNVLTIALENISANLLDNDNITGLTSGATALINVTITDQNRAGGEGVLLALDDNGTTGDFYVQLISGSAPVDNLQIEGRTSGATALVNITVTTRTVSPEFIGQSTGTNIIGAYGIGFQPGDVGASDTFFDLTNTQRTPPNNVTFSITGLVVGEDRVLVGPRTGVALEKGQWLLSTALVGATETAVVIKTGAEAAPIAVDTPANGQGANNSRLRVQMNSGVYRRQDYASWTGSTFTIPSTDYSGANAAAIDQDVFLAYIDILAAATTEGYTAVYSGADRNLAVRVRDGGATPIKSFATNAVFGSSNSSVAAIRTSDA